MVGFQDISRTRIDGRIPLNELFVSHPMVRLNRVALVTRNNLVELVTVLGQTRLSELMVTV